MVCGFGDAVKLNAPSVFMSLYHLLVFIRNFSSVSIVCKVIRSIAPFKIAYVVILLVFVLMINEQPTSIAEECACYKPMNS